MAKSQASEITGRETNIPENACRRPIRRRVDRSLGRTAFLVVAGAWLAALSPLNATTETKVGDTRDACDKAHDVKFQTSTTPAIVPANIPLRGFDLPALTHELTWYCGGSRERSANGAEFNKVEITRAKNGAIQWTFVRVDRTGPVISPPLAQGSVPLLRMGDSRDACDRSQPVTFQAKAGPVSLAAGQMVLKELPLMTRNVSWKCGSSNENVANPNAFDFIQAERAGNGAIQWVFYRTPAASDDSTGDYFDLVPGDVVIQVPAANQTKPMPGFFKQQLDAFWAGEREKLPAQILKDAPPNLGVKLTGITLSPPAKTELRVGGTPTDVRVKYVVHENVAQCEKSGANINAIFDLELTIILPREQKLPLKAQRATLFVHHFEAHGASPGDDFLAAFFKSKIHSGETSADNTTRDATDLVNAALAPAAPGPAGTPFTLDQNAGTIEACVKITPADVCNFPAAVHREAVRRTLDTSHDQCSQDKIWIWDYQKGGFVALGRGASGLVEVDNQRFEWFCGGNNEPDTANDEWATGPEGTFFVLAKRESAGSQIDWSFQSWH